MIKTIQAVGLFMDGGDGGGSVRIYPDLETLKEDYFMDDVKYADNDEEREEYRAEGEQRFQSALSGENTYEDGEIHTNIRIEVEVDEKTGNLKLAKDIYFHFGQ